MTLTRVALLEHDPIYRATLYEIISRDERYLVVGAFEDGEAALDCLRSEVLGSSPWHVVLVDLDLPEADVLETIRQMTALAPELCVIVLTVFDEAQRLAVAILAGANGYLIKSEVGPDVAELVALIETGGTRLTPGLLEELARVVVPEGESPTNPPTAPPQRTEPQRTEPQQTTPQPTVPQRSNRDRYSAEGLVSGRSARSLAHHLEAAIDTVRSYFRTRSRNSE